MIPIAGSFLFGVSFLGHRDFYSSVLDIYVAKLFREACALSSGMFSSPQIRVLADISTFLLWDLLKGFA